MVFKPRKCQVCKKEFAPSGTRSVVCAECFPAFDRARISRRVKRGNAKKRQHVATTGWRQADPNRSAKAEAVKLLWDSGDHEAIGAWLTGICLREIAASVAKQEAMIEDQGGVNPSIDAMMREEWS